MSGKQKMSNRKFRALLIPPVALLTIIAVVGTIAATSFSVALDDYIGKGSPQVHVASGTQDWDTQYYDEQYADNNESKDASYDLALQVQDEGSVLLKNNGVLPLAEGSTVIPFGYRYMNPIYGQVSSSGSAKWTIDPVTPEEGLQETFTIDNAAVDAMNAAGDPEPLTEAEGTTSAGAVNDLMGGDSKILEYDPSIYEGLPTSSDETAIVVISRAGQEGSDKKYDAYTDGTPHYLALSQNEQGMIRAAKETCGKVVVVVASSAPMELTPLLSGDLEVDAILQVGHVGERGFAELGAILSGAVNPSGRTVDIWPTDFTKDPTYQNFGEFTYGNATFTNHAYGEPTAPAGDGSFYRYFIEYQEDMYVGYRYYETADVEDPSFVYGELDNGGAVTTAGAVAYPFGYGLSYTSFEQGIVGYDDAGDDIVVDVEVTNTGDMAGKQVVQLYYGTPYTQFDIDEAIEKPATQLGAFAKTEVLEPGASQTVTLTIAKEDMASYGSLHDNGDGTQGAYVLEQGDYDVMLCNNSHDVIDVRTWTNPETEWFDSSNPRQSEVDAQSSLDDEGNPTGENASGADVEFVAAHNLFEESTEYMRTQTHTLSRADWTGTFPTRPENGKEIDQSFVDSFGIEETFDPQTDASLGNVEGSAVYAAEDPQVVDSDLMLSDMRGVDYNDERWDQFLDQIDYSDSEQLQQIVALMTGANYATTAVDRLGLFDTREADGANGIKAVKTDAGMELSATYGFAPLMASTWNTELLYEVGNMFGQEAMANGISGWYSPAINLHRSPFSGRVFEYYSEDPLLTGMLASSVISGAGDAGMVCYVKHFAVNDQETHREFWLHTWATEQTMRELYLKAFELPIKQARMTIRYTSDDEGTVSTKTMRAATAVMASQNNIGSTVAHANYALLTSLLRDEWGFDGLVHTDMFIYMGNTSMYDLTFRAGSDTFLTYSMIGGMEDRTSPTSHAVMRRALHDVCYAFANSAAMQGVGPGSYVQYSISPWRIALIVADVVVALLVAGAVFWMVRRTTDEKRNPDKYKQPKKRSRKTVNA